MKGLIPTFPREAMESLYDLPLYDEAAVRELVMLVGPPNDATGRAAAMAFVLTEIAKSFGFSLWREAQASTPLREEQATRLANACGDVLKIVGVANGGELFPMFANGGLFSAANLRGEPKGEAATMNALRAVDLLRQDALKMLEIESKRRRMKEPKAGNPGSPAMRTMVAELSRFYENVWERAPGISNGDEPSGPLMRIMLDMTKRLRERGLRFTATRDSLRKVWQRLPDDEKMPTTRLLEQARATAEGSGPLSK